MDFPEHVRVIVPAAAAGLLLPSPKPRAVVRVELPEAKAPPPRDDATSDEDAARDSSSSRARSKRARS